MLSHAWVLDSVEVEPHHCRWIGPGFKWERQWVSQSQQTTEASRPKPKSASASCGIAVEMSPSGSVCQSDIEVTAQCAAFSTSSGF